MEKQKMYKVIKVMKKSGNKTLIQKNLTEKQAQELVAEDEKINPNAIKYMWCYYEM